MSPTMRRALEILRDRGPLTPANFAHELWPDAPAWRRVGRCGAYGSARGVGMRLAGGAYIGKLVKRGLVERTFACRGMLQAKLTSAGYRAIDDGTLGK